MYFKTPCQGHEVVEGNYVFLELMLTDNAIGATMKFSFNYINYPPTSCKSCNVNSNA